MPEQIPLDQFADTVIDRVRHRHGRFETAYAGEGRVALRGPDGAEQYLDLHNLWREVDAFTDRGPSDLTGAIDHWLERMLDEGGVPQLEGQAWRDSLRVVVRHRDVVRGLVESQPEGSERGVVSLPVSQDLVALVVSDLGQRLRYVYVDELEAAFDDLDEGLILAQRQTWEEVQPRLEVHGEGPCMLTCGGNYEASLLYYTGVWEHLEEQIEGDLVLAAPARDLVLFADSRDPAAVARIEEIVDDAWERELPYLLTENLAVRRDGDWLPWPPHTKQCDECDRTYPSDRLVCLECDNVLARWSFMTASFGVAAVSLAILGAGWWFDAAVPGFPTLWLGLMVVTYPTLKFLDWRADPSRPVLAEVSSVFSGRFTRLAVLAMVAANLWFLPGLLAGVVADPAETGVLERIWRVVLAFGPFTLAGLLVYEQGQAFFDPRVADTCVERERARLEAAA